MWSDSYDDRVDAPYFEVTCPRCGASRRNDEDDSCSCGMSGASYSSADASRWNRYVDRGRR